MIEAGMSTIDAMKELRLDADKNQEGLQEEPQTETEQEFQKRQNDPRANRKYQSYPQLVPMDLPPLKAGIYDQFAPDLSPPARQLLRSSFFRKEEFYTREAAALARQYNPDWRSTT